MARAGRLSGKVVVVTGASAGVGRAVIEGRREAEPLLLTMETPCVQQKADASLSCHQNYFSPHAPAYRSGSCIRG